MVRGIYDILGRVGGMVMKRWFEIVGQKQTIEIDFIKGSKLSKANVEEISKAMKIDLRELTKSEYKRLTIMYGRG